MNINIKRCYFHSIQPLYRKGVIKKDVDRRIDRLNCMLDYGYIVPSCELHNVLPDEPKMPSNNRYDSVYLAQHMLTELGPVGGSFINGEFSAFIEHIRNSPALVFNEYIIDGKKIDERIHFLSEEVCIQEKIPIKDIIAIYLPYSTPLEKINSFINCCKEESFYPLDECFSVSIRDELASEILKLLMDEEVEIEKQYKLVKKFEECLENHQLAVPCIRYDGSNFNKEEEYEFIDKNKAKVLKLIEKTKRM